VGSGLMPLPAAEWRGCCFDARHDCAAAAIRSRSAGKLEPLLPC
jgi:hypothetical protein